MKELLFEHMIPYLFSTEEITVIRGKNVIYQGEVKNFRVSEYDEISRLEVVNVVSNATNTKTIYLT